MYRLEWIEQLRLSRSPAANSREQPRISSVVWFLGWTSLLTDISSEMVNSVLPVYLVLHLHWSPLQFGVVDGIYNGLAIALLSLWAGYLADGAQRQKVVALAGYSLSCVCKLLLLAAGAAWSWILIIIGLDRLGKGIRSAPRDALISLNAEPSALATAFSLHRAMDACGALLGPIIAFVLLARIPGAFDAIWVTSFTFAVLGVAVLWLFVPKSAESRFSMNALITPDASWRPWRNRRFLALAGSGSLLAAVTISDGFFYLILQERSAASAGFFPLFYVLTAASYMLLSIPAGRMADRTSRGAVFLSGYVILILLYTLVLSVERINAVMLVGCLVLHGLYYAATEGVLMALASAVIPAHQRTSGIAVVATAIGLAKLLSSVVFGALWQATGVRDAVIFFIIALGIALATSLALLRATDNEQ